MEKVLTSILEVYLNNAKWRYLYPNDTIFNAICNQVRYLYPNGVICDAICIQMMAATATTTAAERITSLRPVRVFALFGFVLFGFVLDHVLCSLWVTYSSRVASRHSSLFAHFHIVFLIIISWGRAVQSRPLNTITAHANKAENSPGARKHK